MDNDEWVPREQYEALLGMAARQTMPKAAPVRRKSGGFVRFLCEASLLALAIVGGYFLLEIFVGAPAALTPPTPAQGAPLPPTAPYQPYTTNSRPQPVTTGGGLPSCSTVTDTRTACEPDQSAPAAVEQAAPTVEPTAQPEAVWTTPCETAPGERPCWLPADAAWTPPETVPETPIVLIAPTDAPPLVFTDSVCTAWHPPLPYPEECRGQE